MRPEVNFYIASPTLHFFSLRFRCVSFDSCRLGFACGRLASCGSDEIDTFRKATTGLVAAAPRVQRAAQAETGTAAASSPRAAPAAPASERAARAPAAPSARTPRSAAVSKSASRRSPFNMLILFDQSSSMARASSTAWRRRRGGRRVTERARSSFFQSRQTRSRSASDLPISNRPTPSTFMTSCRVADYATPEDRHRADERSGPGAEARRLDQKARTRAVSRPPRPRSGRARLRQGVHDGPSWPGDHGGFATDGLPTQCEPQETHQHRADHRRSGFHGHAVGSHLRLGGLGVNLTARSEPSRMAGGTGQPVFVTTPRPPSDPNQDRVLDRLTRTIPGLQLSHPAGRRRRAHRPRPWSTWTSGCTGMMEAGCRFSRASDGMRRRLVLRQSG